MHLKKLAISFVVALGLLPGSKSEALTGTPTPNHRGQTVTLLTDGSILITGGEEAGKAIPTAYLLDQSGNALNIRPGLVSARTNHTATALPDGSVLIFGGTNDSNEYVRTMEIFNPATKTFTLWSGPVLVPRSRHTATLLTDGTVAIMGGIQEGGALARDMQIWNFRNGLITSLDQSLLIPRAGLTADFLSTGRVMLRGGQDQNGKAVKNPEIYDPITGSFQILNQAADVDDDGTIHVAETIPADGVNQYPIAEYIRLRFSREINWASLTTTSLTLTSSTGNAVAGHLAIGEDGRLAFLIPTSPLNPGSDYTLKVDGITDLTGNTIGTTIVHFHTEEGDDDGSGDDWIPDAEALNGNFQTRTGKSKWQQLPPLMAEQGVTAVSGQALGTSGRPLPHVTLQIGSAKVETDNTGRFLLRGIPAGRDILIIDGSTAKKRRADYGYFETSVDVKSGVTTVLGYTIWLTRLDTENAVRIPVPTTATDTVITTPRLPGLELHLPAGTTIVGRDGKKIRELSITPVPLDKPPFPLPTGLRVPLYFTIQPGGAEIRTPGSGASVKGARLFYPNSYHEPRGTLYNFWNYDAASKGWYIYGNGQVAASGTQILPNPGVYVYELTGAMVGGGSPKPAIGPGPDGQADGDPVDLASGQFVYSNVDLSLPDVMPIALTRTYISNDHYARPFGVGASDNFDIFMVGDKFPYTYQELILPNGSSIRFNRTSPGTSYTDAVYVSSALSGPFYGAVLSWNESNDLGISAPVRWFLKTKDGTIYGFPDASQQNSQLPQAVLGVQDIHGNRISLVRDNNSRLTQITSPSGRSISLTYDVSSRIVTAADSSGRTASYTYDSGGRLATATDVRGGVTTFTYDSNDLVTTITDPRNITYLKNEYDSFGRVVKQTQADGGEYHFAWTPSQNSSQIWVTSGLPVDRYSATAYEGYTGLISEVDVTDPRGYVHRITYDNLGRSLNETRAYGQPEAQTVSYQHYADNLIKSVTDSANRTTAFDYDAAGNLTSATKLAGTSNAITSTATYDQNTGRPLSFTDPLNHTTSFTYSAQGDLLQVTDPMNHSTSFAYDSAGRPTSITNAASNTFTMGYTGGDLTSVTDPLGNTAEFIPDMRGNVLMQIDPLGNTSTYTYNAANRVTLMKDPSGHTASFGYDADGSLTSIQDWRGHQTGYTYDSMNRVTTTTDPLQRTSSQTYDLAGLPVSVTDRKGQVTSSAYDGLGRRTFIGFGTVTTGSGTTYESTVTYQYDNVNRLTSVADSTAGTISTTYNSLGNILTESGPQGTMTYTYDSVGRRQTAQRTGGTQVSYGYDNASQVTMITQGTSQVILGYDGAGRRNSMALPNGVTVGYGYDQDSRLQTMSYAVGGTTIGALNYAYDAAGRQTDVSGSLANTNLPLALSQATYDASDQLTSWSGLSPVYDANGSMTTDISGNQYVWNTRNQLTSVTGTANQTYAYDAFGRRVSKTVGSQSNSFQYDGGNRIVEAGASSSTTFLTAGLDETLKATDGSGSVVPITDGRGSTIGLVDASGSLATSYQYDPYGNTTTAGAASSNSTQYTGRENDNSGLYFYRARYYSPATGRFISQDPAGFSAGMNFYLYAGANPISFRDPAGLDRHPGGPGAAPSPFCWLFGCIPGAGGGGPTSTPNGPQLGTGPRSGNGPEPGGEPSPGGGPNEKKGFFDCAAEKATEASLSTAVEKLPGFSSGPGQFVADALFGNTYSGITDIARSINSGASGGHGVFYNLGLGVAAGPTQGFGPIFGGSIESTVWDADVVSRATAAWAEAAGGVTAEFITGVGEIKLAYDTGNYAASLAQCALSD